MLRKLYNWVLQLAGGPQAEPALAIVSFAESSFFPIPPDVMLAPMCLARPERWIRYALLCTIASVVGGLLGYAIGYFLFEAVGQPILNLLGSGGKIDEFRATYDKYGLLVIFLKGLTPIPFKLVTIVSGAMHFMLPAFVGACVITRGLRFFAVAWVFKTYGPTLAPVIEKRIGLVTAGVAILLVGGVILATQLH